VKQALEASQTTARPLLEIDGVSKSFPGVRALDAVTFDVRGGEIHALLGQNGAGKSTLMHILAGVLRPDAGRVMIDGQAVEIRNPADGQRRGIAIVHQELSLFPSRSVAENIFVGRLPRTAGGFVDDARLIDDARALLRALDIPVDPSAKVRALDFSLRQLVEIAKALSFGGKILILDEPTSALTEIETANLLTQLRRLKNNGIAIIYVSHRLREVFELCDRISVLRDGRRLGTYDTAKVTPDEIIAMMASRTIASGAARRTAPREEVRLSVRGLSVKPSVRSVDFDLRAGEIVGLAGLAGAGQTDIGRAIGGLAAFRAAELRYDGRPIRSRTPTEALRDGIVYLPADRRAEGLFLRLDVRQNIVASTLRELSLGPWMRDASAAETASQFVRSLRIRTPSLRQQVGNLSGGNQQKVVLARGLTVNSGLVIADDPTRGIDVGTKAEIYDLLRGLADAGKTVLLISSEVPELLAVCDRILVIRAGRVAAELDRAAASEERIMSLASGDFARAS